MSSDYYFLVIFLVSARKYYTSRGEIQNGILLQSNVSLCAFIQLLMINAQVLV
jgi:hypothetical protein